MKPGTSHTHFKYNYAHSGLIDWLSGFSSHLQVNTEDNRIEYPEKFGTGFAKVYNLEPGLAYRIVDYTLNIPFAFIREPSENFFLIIYFYQYYNSHHIIVKINNDDIIDSQESYYSTLLMTNSVASQEVILSKGTKIKGLTIQLSEEWLRDKIRHPGNLDYSIFKEKDFFQDFLTAKSQKLLNEIFAENSKSFTPALHINIRVLRLLEGFLQNILHAGGLHFPLFVSPLDFQKLLKIEALLLENYSSGFPKIEKLARLALMSETKLKNIFKKAFGMGLYEYYQKNRMRKAKELLNLNLYSVTEVGTLIGYQNLSNFSRAFKKEFGYLPKYNNKKG
jgi:AraC-like DNA-binding protein